MTLTPLILATVLSSTPESKLEHELEKRMPREDYVTIMGLTDTILAESESIGVDPRIVLGIIHVESRFKVRATSPKSCKGLMQLEPSTMSWFVQTFGDKWPSQDIYDPIDNVRIATRYLGYLLSMFDGNLKLSLMAYNAGPGKLRKWLRQGRVPKQVRDYQAAVFKASESFGEL